MLLILPKLLTALIIFMAQTIVSYFLWAVLSNYLVLGEESGTPTNNRGEFLKVQRFRGMG